MENENENELREPAVVYGRSRFTEEEYLDIERIAIQRHEFYNGEIFHMYGHGDLLTLSGAAHEHNEIFTNLFGELCIQLKGSKCRPYGPDKRLHIPENSLYTYPDISVYCNAAKADSENDNSINPTVIIEILSPSTRSYDMGEKFELYKDIPTLKEYIIIDTKMAAVYAYRTGQNNCWKAEEYKKAGDIVEIKALNISISLEDIYAGTKLMF